MGTPGPQLQTYLLCGPELANLSDTYIKGQMS
jgi:hypothetical protein